jgi:hypothetical protein
MHYYNNEDRMILFSDLDNEFRRFFLKYRIKGKFENSHYPFGKLENDGFWEVSDSNKLKRTSVGHLSKKELLEKRVRGGVIKEVYLYLMDNKFLLLSIMDKIIADYFPTLDRMEVLDFYFLSNNQIKEARSNLPPNKISKSINEIKGKSMDIKHNGYINYLNSLHNLNASGANALAESQALNQYFTEIYEPFPLVERLYQALTSPKEQVILLTGHAGDGKSTVALDVLKRLQGWPLDKPLETALLEKEEVRANDGGLTYIVKDMSELASEQRMEWLGQGFNQKGSWLIVSNTGPLINSLLEYSKQEALEQGIENKILTLLDATYEGNDLSAHTLSLFSKEVVIINMTRLDNVDLAARILKRMVNHSAWTDCSGCQLIASCSLQANHSALVEMGADLEERIRWIYKRVSAYEQRLTLRQMVAHLALSITGGIDCSIVQASHLSGDQSETELGRGLSLNVFSESFFGYKEGEAWPEAESLLAIRLIRRSMFGGPIAVNFERQLLINGQWTGVKIPENLKSVQQYWQKRSQDPEGVRWRFALRRMLYVFAKDLLIAENTETEQFLDCFIKSPMLRQFDLWQIQADLVLKGDKKRQLLKSCLQTLLEVYSGFCSGQFQEGQLDSLYLTLRRPDQSIIQPTQLVIAKLSNDDFRLSYDSARHLPTLLYKSSEGSAELPLTLPLLDYIYDRSVGNLGNELAPIHLAQLEWFKAELLKLSQHKNSSYEVGLLRSGIDGEVKLHRYVVNEKELEIY